MVSGAAKPAERVRVWDLPIRLFHWSIVLLFGFSWWSAETDRLGWHRLSGYAILALALFRLYWGFAGGDTARFANFLKGPKAMIAYARRLFARPGAGIAVHNPTGGHNPMGGWSVLALLLLLLAQCGLGLFAVDVDGIESGPLDNLVSFDTGREIAGWHGFVFDLLLAFVTLHVAAVLFYLVYKRDNLIAPMIVGTRRMPAGQRPALRFAPLWRALVGMIVAGLAVAWIVFGHF